MAFNGETGELFELLLTAVKIGFGAMLEFVSYHQQNITISVIGSMISYMEGY